MIGKQGWRAAAMLGAMLATAPIVAQASERGGSAAADRALGPLAACRSVMGDGARAACFDGALARLRQAIGDGQVVIVDRQQSAEDRHTLFGLDARRPPPPPRAERTAPSPAEAIDATVVSSRSLGYDLWSITLSTGAVWRSTASGLAFAPRSGDRARIQRGALGGFLLTIGNGPTVYAVRDR